MTASFQAYVDESGDEGFQFRKSSDEEASSDWFVLTAFVTRKKTDLDVVKVIDQVRREFQLHSRKHMFRLWFQNRANRSDGQPQKG